MSSAPDGGGRGRHTALLGVVSLVVLSIVWVAWSPARPPRVGSSAPAIAAPAAAVVSPRSALEGPAPKGFPRVAGRVVDQASGAALAGAPASVAAAASIRP